MTDTKNQVQRSDTPHTTLPKHSSLIGLSELFAKSWEKTKLHWLNILKVQLIGLFALIITLIVVVILLIVSPLLKDGNLFTEQSFIIAALIASMLAIIFLAATIFISSVVQIAQLHTIAREQTEYASPWSMLSQAMPYARSAAVVNIFTGLIVLAGLFLLVVPALIFGVWFSLSIYVFVFEGKKGVEALKESKRLVAGRWWAVFGRLVALQITYYAAFMLVDIISRVLFGSENSEAISGILSLPLAIITIPFSLAYSLHLYQSLRALRPVAIDAVST